MDDIDLHDRTAMKITRADISGPDVVEGHTENDLERDEDMHDADLAQESSHDNCNSCEESMNTDKEAAVIGLMSMGQGTREEVNSHNRITRGESRVGTTNVCDSLTEFCLVLQGLLSPHNCS